MSLLSPQLLAFLAITKKGTVQAAAREIGLTQTGVTQRIRSLESDLSTTLFIRSRKGMRLTREGEALFRYCQGALDLEGISLAQIVGAGRESSVEVALIGPTSLMSSRIIGQCRPLMEQFSKLLFNFKISDLDGRLDELVNGGAHFALVSPEQVTKEMDSKLLRPEKYIMVATKKWKGRRLEEITASERVIDFNPQDQMSFSYLRQFGLLRDHRVERYYVNNNDALLQLFRSGAGYGVLSEEVASAVLARGDLILLNGGKALVSPVALAWYPRPQMPPYFRAIIETIH
jgi:LysR family transcriptional regulator (chromosome initiation inhibitor)